VRSRPRNRRRGASPARRRFRRRPGARRPFSRASARPLPLATCRRRRESLSRSPRPRRWPRPLDASSPGRASAPPSAARSRPSSEKARRPRSGAHRLDNEGPSAYNSGAMRFENVVFDRSVLRRVLDAAERHGERGIAVFDLDSTLFDNRPRQVRILREYGRERGIPELAASRLEHWTSAWLVEEAMVAAGLPRERARELHEDFRAFWEPRFFHSDYCGEDAPIPGAVAFVEKLHARGVRIIYCTGRHEGMRPGTVRALRAHAFPAPGEARAALWMKA